METIKTIAPANQYRYTPRLLFDRVKPIDTTGGAGTKYQFFTDTSNKTQYLDYDFPAAKSIPPTQKYLVYGISCWVTPLVKSGVSATITGYLATMLEASVLLKVDSVDVWGGHLAQLLRFTGRFAGTTTSDSPFLSIAAPFANTKDGFLRFGKGTEIELGPGSTYQVNVEWPAANNASQPFYLYVGLHANKVEKLA